MKRNLIIRCFSILLCAVLITAMALFAWGCESKEKKAGDESTASSVKATEIGKGEHHFIFDVKDADGNLTSFYVKTDKTIVGDALSELELISGDESEYGLYVKTVNGITAEYDKDGCYWAFYVDGEMAMSSVSDTEITDGATYMFAIEK